MINMKNTKLYDSSIVWKYIELYEKNWWMFEAKTWSLLDEYILYWNWLKYTLILEHYLNERSSCYIVKQFKKLPEKYEKYFDFCDVYTR